MSDRPAPLVKKRVINLGLPMPKKKPLVPLVTPALPQPPPPMSVASPICATPALRKSQLVNPLSIIAPPDAQLPPAASVTDSPAPPELEPSAQTITEILSRTEPMAQMEPAARMEPAPTSTDVSSTPTAPQSVPVVSEETTQIPSAPVSEEATQIPSAPAAETATQIPSAPTAPPTTPADENPAPAILGCISLAKHMLQAAVDCCRCSSTRDGLWHTFVSAVPFYQSLWSVMTRRDEEGAEARWYAALERAGIARGEECRALQWPLSDAAAFEQTPKVHRLARELLDLLCKTALRDCDSNFVDQIVIPSLLCLHEQALHRHPTLRITEASLELEELSAQPPDTAATRLVLTQVRNALAWSLPLSTIAQLCCAVVSAPSLGMVCAYQCAKSEPATDAANSPHLGTRRLFVKLPHVPLAALPPNLRCSLDGENTSDGFALGGDWQHGIATPKSVKDARTPYRTLFQPDADTIAADFFS